MEMHRVLVNPRPPHLPIKYIFVPKYIFVIKYISTQNLLLIYNQRTTTCKTINILLVHKPLKNDTVNICWYSTCNLQTIPRGWCPCIPLHIPYKCYQRIRQLGIYKKYIFPNCRPKTQKPKLSACILVFLTAASWHQWWLQRRLVDIPIKSLNILYSFA